MNKLLSLVLCFLTSLTYAQENSKIKYSFKIGVSNSQSDFDAATKKKLADDNFDDTKANTFESFYSIKSIQSLNFGAYIDYSIDKSAALESGITVAGKGLRLNYEDDDEDINVIYRISYLEIPLNLVYKVRGFKIGAGPYAGFVIAGKRKTNYMLRKFVQTSRDDKENINFGNNPTSDFKRFDYGINFNLEYQISNRISAGVGYSLGLGNISPKQNAGEYIKNRAGSISVGYAY